MAEPNIFWYRNSGVGTTPHEAGSGENGDWVAITPGSAGDTLVFTGAGVNDGDATGSRDTVIIPATGYLEVDKTFIDNGSIIDQVPLAGTNQGGQNGGDNQYVFCIYFDGETASPPYLEMWDDSNHNTTVCESLGAGTPADSTVKGIVTTAGAPGSANWVGHPDQVDMAGATNRLDLNVGSAIGSGGGNVYWNQCVRLLSTTDALNDTPVTTLRFTFL